MCEHYGRVVVAFKHSQFPFSILLNNYINKDKQKQKKQQKEHYRHTDKPTYVYLHIKYSPLIRYGETNTQNISGMIVNETTIQQNWNKMDVA